MDPILATILLFIGLILIMRFVFFRTSESAETEAQSRIRDVIQKAQLDEAPEITSDEEKAERQLPFADSLARTLSTSSTIQGEEGKDFMSRLNRNLVRAGMASKYTAEQALASAIMLWLTGFVLAVLILLSGALPKLFAILVFFIMVYYPFSKLRSAIQNRQDTIAAEIPFFIQQLYMAISSGNTNIDGAIERVARNNEKDSFNSIVAEEFGQAHIEYRLNLKSMEDAIRDVGYRTGVISVENLCEAIVQGLRTGTPMQEVLLAYSAQAQEMWKQDIRSFKNRKEPLITIGVVTTMFGAFIIMVTPMLVGLTDSLTNL